MELFWGGGGISRGYLGRCRTQPLGAERQTCGSPGPWRICPGPQKPSSGEVYRESSERGLSNHQCFTHWNLGHRGEVMLSWKQDVGLCSFQQRDSSPIRLTFHGQVYLSVVSHWPVPSLSLKFVKAGTSWFHCFLLPLKLISRSKFAFMVSSLVFLGSWLYPEQGGMQSWTCVFKTFLADSVAEVYK